jgi:hypothetical protein
MLDIEDLPEEIAALAKRCEAIRQNNAHNVTQMERIGVVFDLAITRVEHLMGSLVDLGIITDEQYWALNLEWEESLQRQLKNADSKIREQLANRQNAARQEAAKLVTPEKKLYVPGT